MLRQVPLNEIYSERVFWMLRQVLSTIYIRDEWWLLRQVLLTPSGTLNEIY